MTATAGSSIDRRSAPETKAVPVSPFAVPRHAASLIAVDEGGGAPRFLMGCRNRAHRFMPGVYVFPGGGVEAGDMTLSLTARLCEAVRLRLSPYAALDERHLAALPLAAIRETFEETGFLLGSPAVFDDAPANWRDFAKIGFRPAYEHLVPVGRAITPPHYPVRYDARFFAVSRARLLAPQEKPCDPSDELDDIGWFSLDELGGMPLADITRRILSDVADRIAAATLFDPLLTMPFYSHEDGVSKRNLI
ncbi:NUDIX hydrolase [Fulvimarina sp. 2208YS6-2-32]|uniref:NUDIX hydrolase n=1 Tax=Fulvimarina uroteuthidis TaxID=3098149 RepID=A0ABU5I338_9HYPH|nr:NUDIX hydrolase [Fulvimarina sp. 2208YS6-2-32]MDY8109768.1 NUDIX hydrolase [Fulvimarina sp. 2208YS6-2-32]